MARTRTATLLTIILFLLVTTASSQELPVKWDSLVTPGGHGLTVANNGNAGNSGIGSVNLDFVGPGIDCTSGEANPADVYLYDLTPIIMQSQSNYSWQPYWTEARASDRDFVPITHQDTTAGFDWVNASKYRTGHFMTSDSSLGFVKHWLLRRWGLSRSFVIERWEIYSMDGAEHSDVHVGSLTDWNIPSDLDQFNPGSADSANGLAILHGYESHSGEEGDCQPADQRFAFSGLLSFYYTSELLVDWRVNHTDLAGIQIRSKDELFSAADTLISDSVWNRLNETGAQVSYSQPDQVVMINYGQFNIIPGDTLVLWTMHGACYDSDSLTVADFFSDWRDEFYRDHEGLVEIGCCGLYTGGYPGNTDCSPDGKITLADITRLIDATYISKKSLCCNANGDVSGGGRWGGLANITLLIDHLYISKSGLSPCL